MAARILALAASVLLCGLVCFTASLRLGLWDTDRARAERLYAQPPSRFVSIDGVRLHVRIEGDGPVVVMLHGSIVNLHEWDQVADNLRPHYRVVRLDWPPYGLSGPDPSGVYSNARAAFLLSGLVDSLHFGRFSLVATSNGGNVALEYYAHHPEHVNAMAFSILPLERPSQTRRMDWRIVVLRRIHQAILPHYHFPIWYRLIIEDTSPPGFHPDETFVDMVAAIDNLPGSSARQDAYIQSTIALFKTQDVGASAEGVRVPVLLQWCDYDTVISQSAARTATRFTHAKVTLITYPDLGHFPMLQDPVRFSTDLSRFLASAEGSETAAR